MKNNKDEDISQIGYWMLTMTLIIRIATWRRKRLLAALQQQFLSYLYLIGFYVNPIAKNHW